MHRVPDLGRQPTATLSEHAGETRFLEVEARGSLLEAIGGGVDVVALDRGMTVEIVTGVTTTVPGMLALAGKVPGIRRADVPHAPHAGRRRPGDSRLREPERGEPA